MFPQDEFTHLPATGLYPVFAKEGAGSERAAFALPKGQISSVLESPIGLHIIRCDEIFPSGLLAFDEVREQIIERQFDKRQRKAQRDWIVACLAD
ncbi:peptidylprolyl isomerase [Propionivibrio sp.]|uniref:peptidylprolyl isomerase n=1 Tax=Propionivibrio sp. TaxID=2212460 RepID=UPI003BF07CDA